MPSLTAGIDMPAVSKGAAVAKAPARREIGNVIHRGYSSTPSALGEVTGVAAVMQAVSDVPAPGIAGHVALEATRHSITNKTADL